MGRLEQETEKLILYLKDYSFNDLVEDDKEIVRNFLRERVRLNFIDSYASDYTDDEFRVSLIKGKDEKIILVKEDGIIRWN